MCACITPVLSLEQGGRAPRPVRGCAPTLPMVATRRGGRVWVGLVGGAKDLHGDCRSATVSACFHAPLAFWLSPRSRWGLRSS
jgi:hypothetical protein